MPRKSKVDILAEKAAAGDIDALKELALLAKPKPKKKATPNVKAKTPRKKKAIKVAKILPENPEPEQPEPQATLYRPNASVQIIQQRRAAKVQEIQGSQHAGTTPAKFAPFQVKERPNRWEDKQDLFMDEVKIHAGKSGSARSRNPVEFVEVSCVYCKRTFVVPNTFRPSTEDGGFCCNPCSANAKR